MTPAIRIATFRTIFAAMLVARFGGSTVALAQATVDDPRRAQIAEAITAAMKRHDVPGASISVVNDYRIDWAEGFGTVKAGEAKPVTPTTLFQAASVSKPLTALAAMRRVELGKLQLDEDVNPKLASWHIPDSPMLLGRPITLRRLLSHSAGLNVHGFPGYAADASLPTLLQVLAGAPPANTAPINVEIKPGYMWRYSGGGYSIVQQLLIDVTGVPFPDFMRQTVLEPLGMTHSTYEQPMPNRLVAEAAIGHRAKLKPIAGGWHVYPELAAAGLWTTPSDLALVVIDVAGTAAGRNGKLLASGTIAEMLKVQSGKYGLGFAIKGEARSLSFSHGGGNEGYRCLLAGVPATGQGVVIMTNSDTGGALLAEVMPVVVRAYGWPGGP